MLLQSPGRSWKDDSLGYFKPKIRVLPTIKSDIMIIRLSLHEKFFQCEILINNLSPIITFKRISKGGLMHKRQMEYSTWMCISGYYWVLKNLGLSHSS